MGKLSVVSIKIKRDYEPYPRFKAGTKCSGSAKGKDKALGIDFQSLIPQHVIDDIMTRVTGKVNYHLSYGTRPETLDIGEAAMLREAHVKEKERAFFDRECSRNKVLIIGTEDFYRERHEAIKRMSVLCAGRIEKPASLEGCYVIVRDSHDDSRAIIRAETKILRHRHLVYISGTFTKSDIIRAAEELKTWLRISRNE